MLKYYTDITQFTRKVPTRHAAIVYTSN